MIAESENGDGFHPESCNRWDFGPFARFWESLMPNDINWYALSQEGTGGDRDLHGPADERHNIGVAG